MKIAVGSDHGGYDLKTEIIKHLREKGYETVDLGTCSTDSVDYPEYGLAVAEAVSRGDCEKGIVICGTGIGISIAANKVPGIRAAVCANSFMARMAGEHNDANVLALGGRVLGPGLALDIVDTWLDARFAGGRHRTRLDKIAAIERKYLKNT